MNNREHNFISNVVYIYNNEKEIDYFLTKIANCMVDNFEHSEIICVNDGSTDKSLEEIKKFAEKRKADRLSISVINMNQYHGMEKAMSAGVDLSIGDFVFEFDKISRGYGEKEILMVYQKALTGYDIVSAGINRTENLSSVIFYKLFNTLFESENNLQSEDFRILSRRAINRVKSITERTYYRKAIYANCGLKQCYCLYENNPKNINKENTKSKYRVEMATDALILFTKVGYYAAIIMTFLMAVILIGALIYAIALKIVSNPVPGWTSTICFLAFCFLGIFIVSAIIMKYLQVIVELLFKKKECLFESVEKIK